MGHLVTHDEKVLNSTQSLCPECLTRIPAWNVRRGDNVYLVKECPVHGRFSTVVWRGEPAYEGWGYPRSFAGPGVCATPKDRGCPFDCGLCPEHHRMPCAVLLEVTSRCNLRCPVCFADSTGGREPDPGMEIIEGWYRALLRNGGQCNIQLSGGEPTVRDDLPEIVALGKSLGFNFVQINTNGVRLGTDLDYVKRLKAAGLDCAFLQFDGVDDTVYRQIRGKALLRQKEAAIRHCAEQGIGIVLAATLVPGINTADIGALAEYALRLVPHVRGMHFQPIGYMGRYPGTPRDEDRITLPEVIRALEMQTSGRLRAEHFLPPAGENAHCSFHGNITVLPDGSLKPWVTDLAGYYRARAEPKCDGSLHARDFMARQWSSPALTGCGGALCDNAAACVQSGNSLEELLARMRSHTLSISGMAFQDVWNLDLDRLRDCHIGTLAHDRRIIPFCAYNLSSRTGQTLYRTQDASCGQHAKNTL